MLSVLGIALAIACVVVVRTISSSFAITGADSVTDVLGGAQLWVVPAAGVHYNPDVRALVADGAAPELSLPAGWTGTQTPSGVTTVNGTSVQSFSNLNKSAYAQRSVNLSAYAGQTVTLKWTGTEDSSLQTSFFVDDTALTLS